MLDSETIKTAVDAGTSIINLLDTTHGKVIALVAAVKLMAKFKGFSLKGIGTSLVDSIKQISIAQQTLATLTSNPATKLGQGYDPTNVNLYAAAVSNLTAKQQANMLASAGLSKAQIQLALQYNGLNEDAIREATAHVLVKQAKDQEKLSDQELLANKILLSAASLKLAGDTDSLAVAEYLEANASELAAAADAKQMIMASGLSDAQKAAALAAIGQANANMKLGASIKALFASNPVGFILTIATTLLSLLPIFDMIGESAEEAAEKAARAAQEATQAYTDAKNEIEQNLRSLTTSSDTNLYETLTEEFDELVKGVNHLGENVSLTAEQYERYKSICEDIVGISPALARGHDSATEAIGQNADALRELIELEKERQRQNALDYTTGENWDNVVTDSLNQYQKASEKAAKLLQNKGTSKVDLNSEGVGLSHYRGDIIEAFSGKDDDVLGWINLANESNKKQNDEILEKFRTMLSSLGFSAEQIQAEIDRYTYRGGPYGQVDFSYGSWINDNIEFLQENIHLLDGEFAELISEYEIATRDLESAQRAMVNTLTEVPMSMREYGDLSDSNKSFIEQWIQNSGMFEIDENTTADTILKWKQTIKSMVGALADDTYTYTLSDGTVVSAKDIVDSIFDLDPSKVDWSSYQEQIRTLIDYLWTAIGAENNTLGFTDKNALALTFGFDIQLTDDNESEMIQRYATLKNLTEKKAKEYFDSLPATVVQKLLKIDWNLVDGDNIDQTIANAMGGSTYNTTSVQTYSELSAGIESYNEVLVQTSEIISDNTEVTQEYKDSLTELGLSEEELAECFDENNGLIVKNAALLNKLVKQKKQDKQATVQQARAYSQLQYKTTINQIGQLVNRMATEIKATGYVTAATLKNIDVLRQQLITIKQTIQQYALLELSLSDAAQAYSDFEAAKARDAQLTYGNSMVDALNVLNEGFKTGQVGSEAFQYAVKLIVPPEVYENIDNVQERMQAIHDYVDMNPVFADWFTIDEGQISITMDNIKAFIQDGLNGVDGRAPAFIGTLEDFDLSSSIQSVEDLAAALGTTEAVTLAMLTEFEKYDASWGDIVARLTTTELDRNIEDATTALEEAITAQEQFIKDGKRLYDENGNYTKEYQEIVNGVTQAYNDLGTATKAAVDNATTFTQIDTLLQGLTGELKLSQEQADGLARSLGLIGENSHITINTETGALELTQEQIDILNAKLDLLKDPTILDIQLASDEIDRQLQELEDYKNGGSNKILTELEIDSSEVDSKIAELTSTQEVIELVYNITPSNEQNDSNLEKLGEWEANGVNIVVRADTTECKADFEEINAVEMDEKSIEMTTNADETNAKIDTVTNNNPPNKNVNLSMQGISTALSEINSVSSALASLSGTSYHTVVIQYDNRTSGRFNADGNFHIDGGAFATGTVGAPKTETSLVGELGPELIVDPSTGRWHTVGDHGAEFTQVKRGQIIFNHLQTKQLLENGYVTSRGRLQGGNSAFASGTAYGFGIYDDYVGKDDAFANGSDKWVGSGGNAWSDAADKISDAADDAEQVVDFIEMKLEEIEAIIEKTSSRIANFLDDTTSIKSKDELYDELVKAEKDKSEAYLKAAQKYNVEAAAALSGVPKQYQKMARNGAIEIKDFIGENQVEIAEKIQEYRDWAAKADEAENGHLEAIAAISAHRVEQLEDIATDFENIVSIAKSHSDLLQAEMDFIEESGGRLSESYYEELKKNSQKQLDDMQAERKALQKILDDAVAAGDVVIGSDDWYSMLETIYDVDKEIIDCKTSLEEFQNAINELYWDNFEKFITEIENVDSELSNLYDLISDDDDIVDEMGNWTDKGITALGLLAQQMENAQFKSQQYGEAIEKLKKDYANGLYSADEYTEKLAELTDEQYSAIKSYEDAKDAIVNLNKTRAEAVKKYMQDEIDAYSELIEKKKEALNEDKSAYDFQKQIQESDKNIKDIERKIAALAGNTSSSAMAQRKRLEAELLKAKEEQQDMYYNHSIEKQQEALDKELEDYTKNKQDEMDALDEYLKKEEQVIADSFDLIAENTQVITNTLIKISEEYGVTISDTVASPWLKGANAIGTYEEQLNTSVSATTKNLEALKKQLEDIQKQADKTAESIVKATHSTVVKANDGQQTSIKGYAKGSKNVKEGQWAITDEFNLGEELTLHAGPDGRLQYLTKGSGVVAADLTERLMEWGSLDPSRVLEQAAERIGTPNIVTTNNNISIDMSIAEVVHIDHADNSAIPDITKAVKTQMDNYMRDINNKLRRK